MGGEKEDKAQFMAIVKKVATLVKDSDPKVLVLNESTLDQYGLQPKVWFKRLQDDPAHISPLHLPYP